MSTPEFDQVLQVTPPRFTREEAFTIAAETFGVSATGVEDLGSERDQTLMLVGTDGPLAVMKISNPAEDPEVLDMEALVALHARRADPTLPVALPRLAPGHGSGDDPAAYRVRFDAEDGSHFVRMYDVLPGRGRFDATTLSDAAVSNWGQITARLGRATRGFFHSKAQRTMLWDVQHAPRTRALLPDVRDPGQRAMVERVLDRFDEVVAPVWPILRAQVVHGDLTVDNALIDDDGMITAIIDFGDMGHSALVTDVSSILDSLVVDREPEEIFRVARLVLDGYQRVTPLEPIELRILGELLATRSAVTIAISSWRVAKGLENAEFAGRYNGSVARTIEVILDAGWDEVARRLGSPGRPSPDLAERRTRALGPAMEPLTYEHPITMASARGVWMTDTEGRTYLDAYNNVPCVGHSHPRVTEAIARQSRLLNTNMRYLHAAAVELAERLIATCPPGLDTVLFVNSGSEANDLAWRLATTYTGNRGGLCTAMAYHGISDAIAPLSPETWPASRPPQHIEAWEPPDTYRGLHADPSVFAAALERLAARDHAPAAAILDAVLTSDGFYDLDPALVQTWVRLTHEAGGLWIADEVQGGHGRTGDAMWSFQRHGIEPDFVTLGKPMGNGHPVAAVITRREIAERFAEETVFFSTFGGNPVSAAAGLAVLDVLEDERVLPRVVLAGEALRAAIREVASRHPAIGDVRGMGLANGIEIVSGPASSEPDGAGAAAIKDRLREHGVLVGSTGHAGNILKVRPPLAFTTAEVPVFAAALDAALGAG
ncbi:MAG: aminotransferase class III-fold pyridoxal phosphate-dependent enzyme [Actinomycetota bacterium]